MSDGMETYRAYLSARHLADALLAAHHDRAGRKHHLREAQQELAETRERIGIAVTAITAPADAPA